MNGIHNNKYLTSILLGPPNCKGRYMYIVTLTVQQFLEEIHTFALSSLGTLLSMYTLPYCSAEWRMAVICYASPAAWTIIIS